MKRENWEKYNQHILYYGQAQKKVLKRERISQKLTFLIWCNMIGMMMMTLNKTGYLETGLCALCHAVQAYLTGTELLSDLKQHTSKQYLSICKALQIQKHQVPPSEFASHKCSRDNNSIAFLLPSSAPAPTQTLLGGLLGYILS